MTRLETSILNAIRAAPGIYGVPLRQVVTITTGRAVSYGSLYAALDALEDQGWVTQQLEHGGPERGGVPKACWHLRKPID